jgi:amino acid transporter
MTVRGAAFLGIGSMVGAGIFALLGEAGAVAGPAVWLSFLLAGIVATLQGYAVAKLGARYPSSGGIVTFLLKGFGAGHLTAVASWMLYFAAIIVTAMVAVSFGSYGASLFIVVTLAQMDSSLLAFDTYPPAVDIVSSVALTFFAYLGFAVISFTGGDLPHPSRSLPRAMYLALAVTTALYILVSIGVFGTLTVPEVIDNGETALAVAARPALGDAGFAIMAVAALLATSSSVNANIYAATGSSAKLAEAGEFPAVFGQRARVGGTRGLLISVAVVLLLANLVDLTAIASLGSVVALVIFLITSLAALRLRRETASQPWVIVLGIAATVLVLTVFAVQTLRDSPETFAAMIAVVALAVALDLIWSRIRQRRQAAHPPDGAAGRRTGSQGGSP